VIIGYPGKKYEFDGAKRSPWQMLKEEAGIEIRIVR
jgi:hypothetical protein